MLVLALSSACGAAWAGDEPTPTPAPKSEPGKKLTPEERQAKRAARKKAAQRRAASLVATIRRSGAAT